MSFPLVLCTGMLRSGSTWSFNVCRLMGKVVAGRERKPMWSGYLVAEQTDAFFNQIEKNHAGPTILKTHKLTERGLKILHEGGAKAICTFRDPRDCVASMMTFADQSFEVAMQNIGEALKNLNGYADSSHTLFIRYEEMIADRPSHIRRIAGHLGVAIDETLCRKIDEQTGIEQSERIARGLRNRPGHQVLQSMNHRVDPESWLHDNHIHSGKSGRWKEEMSEQQAQLLTKAYEPWLERLGYEDRVWKSAV